MSYNNRKDSLCFFFFPSLSLFSRRERHFEHTNAFPLRWWKNMFKNILLFLSSLSLQKKKDVCYHWSFSVVIIKKEKKIRRKNIYFVCTLVTHLYMYWIFIGKKEMISYDYVYWCDQYIEIISFFRFIL